MYLSHVPDRQGWGLKYQKFCIREAGRARQYENTIWGSMLIRQPVSFSPQGRPGLFTDSWGCTATRSLRPCTGERARAGLSVRLRMCRTA
jgi:hypothetical protein